MNIKLSRIQGYRFEAVNNQGHRAFIDIAAASGGSDQGIRPMEMLLMSLAGCSGVDVVMILEKGRQPLEGLTIEVDGQRKDAVPATFETIHVTFTATGGVPYDKLERAVNLSMEKYCSVAFMLRETAKITWSCAVAE